MAMAAKVEAVAALVVLVPVGLATVVLAVLLRKATEKVELAEEILLEAVLRLRRKVAPAKVSQLEV